MFLHNKMNKLGVALVAAVFLFSASAGVADAAKGGAKLAVPKVSAPKPAPKPAAPATTQKADKPNQEYAPSKKASDLKDTAPAAKAGTNATAANAATANTGSRWGSALRNIGLLAGGMMLGGLLANMFGLGGMFGDILGLLANVAIFFVAFTLIKMVIGYFLNKRRGGSSNPFGGSDPYGRRERPAQQDHQTVSSQPFEPIPDIRRDSKGMVNVKPMQQNGAGGSYDARETADRYRRM